MKTYFIFFLILISFGSATPLFADQQELFKAANEAYQKGAFKQAIEHYQAILATDNFSQEVYFNLGNAYYKTNNLGKAILNYERALLHYPGDPDTQVNLEIAKTRQRDNLDQIGQFFLTSWWQNIHQFFSSSVWSTITILLVWGSVGGYILWLLGATRERKKQGFIVGILLSFLSILFFFINRSQANYELNSSTAVVLQEEIEVKNAPDTESTNVLTIHEGLKVELLDQIGDWYKVKLSNGDQGWLPKGSLEEI